MQERGYSMDADDALMKTHVLPLAYVVGAR
jgi:hypothetical protein